MARASARSSVRAGAQPRRVLSGPGGAGLVKLGGEVVEHRRGFLEAPEGSEQRGGVAPLTCGDAGHGLGDSLYEAVIYVAGSIDSLGSDAVITDIDTHPKTDPSMFKYVPPLGVTKKGP